MDMVTTLEVKNNVTFASAQKLQNGQVQLTYNEVIEGTAQKGQTAIPENLVLVMAPIEGSGLYVIDAKLRYRMAQGSLTLGVELHRPLDVLERAFDERITDLGSKVGSDLLYQGGAPDEVKPEARR